MLTVAGSIIYYFTAILFIITLLVHIVRFALRPSLIVNSFTHPDEGLHVSIFPAAFGMLILNGAAYTDALHNKHDTQALRAFFWIYLALTLVFGIGSPLAQFSRGAREARERGDRVGRFTGVSSAESNKCVQDFTAASVQPILPYLLAGPIAAATLEYMKSPDAHPSMKAIGILAFGIALQGAGAILSIMVYTPPSSTPSRKLTPAVPLQRRRTVPPQRARGR